jgi:hypothetical protein
MSQLIKPMNKHSSRRVNMHTHSHESPAQTEGRLIRWASFYDASVKIMTLSQVRRLRTLTVEHTLLKPGEKPIVQGWILIFAWA